MYEKLEDFTSWMQKNPVEAPFILTFAMMIGEILFIPGSILKTGAGYAFKMAYKKQGYAIMVGSASAWIGISLGAIVTLLLGRFVFKHQALKIAEKYPTFKALDKAVESEGLKLMILLRLCPLIPFTVINFTLGLTCMTMRDYCIGLFAMIPVTILYVFFGTTLQNIHEAVSGTKNMSDNKTIFIVMIVGSILALGGLIWISIVAKKYLDEILKQQADIAAVENESGENENTDRDQEKLTNANGPTQANEEIYEDDADQQKISDETT